MVKPQPLMANKKIASSSLIRNFLQKGELKKANRILNELSNETDLDSSWLKKLNDIKPN